MNQPPPVFIGAESAPGLIGAESAPGLIGAESAPGLIGAESAPVVIGAGPAGLAAAQALCAAGRPPVIYDAMPSPARKFLRAGIGGLNLTHSEPFEKFLSRYGERAARMEQHLRAFGPEQLRAWAADLGVETFIGSSGRVFPVDFKAAPLLRAWLRRLRDQGCIFHMRHKWLGWTPQGGHRFLTPQGEIIVDSPAALFALGGGSWPRLGSDGAWIDAFSKDGLSIAKLRPANCGFEVAWSEHFRTRFAGSPVKSVGLSFAGKRRKGEFVVTETGIEGGAIYALSAALRDEIERNGQAVMQLDLKPDHSIEKLAAALAKPRGSRSWSSHMERSIGLKGVLAGLLREALPPEQTINAAAIKTVPLVLHAPRPLAEAISSAGGLDFAELDDNLMLLRRPGTFLAGEMLDWEAPTGGYLLTACFAQGRAAGQAAAAWLQHKNIPART